MIMRIWKHIRKYWFYIVCSLIFAALSVASQLYVPILTGNAIDHMIGVGKVDFAGVAAIVRVIVAATAVTAISQWIFGICNNKITYNVSRDLRNARSPRSSDCRFLIWMHIRPEIWSAV